jgi:hypothetical protein
MTRSGGTAGQRTAVSPPAESTQPIDDDSSRFMTGQHGQSSPFSIEEEGRVANSIGSKGGILTPRNTTFSPDGTRLAFPNSETELVLMNLQTGEMKSTKLKGRVQNVAFSPDGQLLAVHVKRHSMFRGPYDAVLSLNSAMQIRSEIKTGAVYVHRPDWSLFRFDGSGKNLLAFRRIGALMSSVLCWEVQKNGKLREGARMPLLTKEVDTGWPADLDLSSGILTLYQESGDAETRTIVLFNLKSAEDWETVGELNPEWSCRPMERELMLLTNGVPDPGELCVRFSVFEDGHRIAIACNEFDKFDKKADGFRSRIMIYDLDGEEVVEGQMASFVSDFVTGEDQQFLAANCTQPRIRRGADTSSLSDLLTAGLWQMLAR